MAKPTPVSKVATPLGEEVAAPARRNLADGRAPLDRVSAILGVLVPAVLGGVPAPAGEPVAAPNANACHDGPTSIVGGAGKEDSKKNPDVVTGKKNRRFFLCSRRRLAGALPAPPHKLVDGL